MKLKSIITVLALLSMLAASGASVSAAGGGFPPDSFGAGSQAIYDNSIYRDRVVTDNTLNPYAIYFNRPFYMSLTTSNASLGTLSTPTYYNGIIYEYAYVKNQPEGYLYAMNAPSLNALATQEYAKYRGQISAMPHHFIVPTSEARTPIRFNTSNAFDAAGQDMLTTEQGWQSIAVGTKSYAWRYGSWPTTGNINQFGNKIWGNPHNNNFQVDMGPLITPPISVQYVQEKKVGNKVTEVFGSATVPFSVAGSWDGGVVATPLGLPPNSVTISPPRLSYISTQYYPGDTNAEITSDPSWVGNCPGIGPDCVAFGVASAYKPRLVLWSLATGVQKNVGVGQVTHGISDATMTIPTASGTEIMAHDITGAYYVFSASGKLIYKNAYNASNSYIYGKDATIAGAVSNPVTGGTDYLAFTIDHAANYLDLVLLGSNYAEGVGVPIMGWNGITSPSTVVSNKTGNTVYNTFFSSESYTPPNGAGFTLTRAGSNINVLRYDPSTLGLALSLNSNFQNKVYSNGQVWSAPIESYIGVVPDVTSEQYLMTATNHAPTSGVNPAPNATALEFFPQIPYQIQAQPTATEVSSGGTVGINAFPIPYGVTAPFNDPARNVFAKLDSPFNSYGSPLYAVLTSSLGTVKTAMYRGSDLVAGVQSQWNNKQIIQLPQNSTGKPVTWQGTVYGVDSVGTKAQSIPFTFVEDAGLVSTGGVLTFNPNPGMWTQQIIATLNPAFNNPTPFPAPTPPAGARNVTVTKWVLSNVTLNYPRKNPNWAVSLPYTPVGTVQTSMSVDGTQHEATTQFLENFWDGGCHTPVAGACVWIHNDLLPISDQSATIPAGNFTPSATYTITTYWTYQQSFTTIVDNDPNDPNEASETPAQEAAEKVKKTFWRTVTGTPVLKTYTVNGSFIVDGTAKDVVGGG